MHLTFIKRLLKADKLKSVKLKAVKLKSWTLWIVHVQDNTKENRVLVIIGEVV